MCVLAIDLTQEEKMKREMDRLKRRAMSSSIMKEIEKEYTEAPEEIKVKKTSKTL